MMKIGFSKVGLVLLLFLGGFRLWSQQLTLEDLWLKGSFRSSMLYDIQWHPTETAYLTSTFDQGTFIINKNSGDGPQVWLEIPGMYDGFQVSPDTQCLALFRQEEPIYRRSSKYFAQIYSLDSKMLVSVGDTALGKISNLSFSPKGDKVAYCRNNNLYVFDIRLKTEKAITTDGAFNNIIHGCADWVYEEEFEFSKAYVWSADGENLAWYRFDESNVKEYNLQYFLDSYPRDYRFKYPKAGEQNSEVRMFNYQLKSGKISEFTPSAEKDLYYPRLYATNHPDYYLLYELNRTQNHLKIHRYSISAQRSEVVYEEKNSTYVEINDYISFLPKSSSFVFTSERSGFRHLWMVVPGKTPKALTQGKWEVLEFYGVHPSGKHCYYASNEGNAVGQKVFELNLSTKKTKVLTPQQGSSSVSFSSDFSSYIRFNSTLNTPPEVSLVTKDGLEEILVDNRPLKKVMESLSLPKVSLTSFQVDTVSLNAWVLKPKNVAANKKYPVFITVYGGPGHISVSDQWLGYNYFWYQLLADKGYIVVAVDGRGTGGKGVAFKKCTQGKLGQIESDDMIRVAKLLGKESFVDSTRIGIFGWSFGGYLSSLSLMRGEGAFKAAIAVAPVTDWKYYDNIYTERYMNTPQINPEGYKKTSVISYANKLQGNFLLIHGTGDDNVHIQHSYALQDALVNANKQFQSFYYVNKNHGIYGGYTRYHLYKMMTEFIEKNL